MTAVVPMNMALREVRLYGVLGKRFGRVHRLAVGSVREAMQALAVVVPGFERHMIEHSAPGYHVFLGKRGQNNVGVEQLEAPVSEREPICVVPVTAGAKRAGAFQVIAGVVLMVVGAVLTAYGYGVVGQPMMKLGATMALGGVVQLVAGPRKATNEARVENQPSYAFDGPVNTDQEGLPVPLRYGRVICGGARISAGISTDQLVVPAAPAPGWGGGGEGMGLQPLPAFEPIDPIWTGPDWMGQ